MDHYYRKSTLRITLFEQIDTAGILFTEPQKTDVVVGSCEIFLRDIFIVNEENVKLNGPDAAAPGVSRVRRLVAGDGRAEKVVRMDLSKPAPDFEEQVSGATERIVVQKMLEKESKASKRQGSQIKTNPWKSESFGLVVKDVFSRLRLAQCDRT